MRTVVAIDGPAGSGKSTVARRLAGELGFTFLDSGAFYRALTLKALREGVDLEDEDALATLFEQTEINLEDARTFLDGRDVSVEIRKPGLAEKDAPVAQSAKVRAIMLTRLRAYAEGRNVVTEGRDQGSVVFPEAEFKFFLNASIDERARRRFDELNAKGETVDLDGLRREIEARDERDRTRPVAPLIKAADAEEIDTTNLNVDEVVGTLLARIRRES